MCVCNDDDWKRRRMRWRGGMVDHIQQRGGRKRSGGVRERGGRREGDKGGGGRGGGVSGRKMHEHVRVCVSISFILPY